MTRLMVQFYDRYRYRHRGASFIFSVLTINPLYLVAISRVIIMPPYVIQSTESQVESEQCLPLF